MVDEPITVQEGSGFYTDENAWPDVAEHGNGTYGPRSFDTEDAEVEITEEGLEQAHEDEQFVNNLLDGEF